MLAGPVMAFGGPLGVFPLRICAEERLIPASAEVQRPYRRASPRSAVAPVGIGAMA